MSHRFLVSLRVALPWSTCSFPSPCSDVACIIAVVAQTSLLLLNYYSPIVGHRHPAAFTATAITTATTTPRDYRHPLVLRLFILLPTPASLRLSRACSSPNNGHITTSGLTTIRSVSFDVDITLCWFTTSSISQSMVDTVAPNCRSARLTWKADPWGRTCS